MLEEDSPTESRVRELRQRLVLRVVNPEDARGFVIPPANGRVAYRGRDWTDYACGACGYLLAIGVRAGMFQSLCFACGCGALNQVP